MQCTGPLDVFYTRLLERQATNHIILLTHTFQAELLSVLRKLECLTTYRAQTNDSFVQAHLNYWLTDM